MTTYNTYQEAKIANPESEIVTRDGEFNASDMVTQLWPARGKESVWVRCNPADHCMTVEQFLKDGHKFVEGDSFINLDGFVIAYNDNMNLGVVNNTSRNKNRYILRAAALEQPKEEVEQPKHTKVEYVNVTDSIFDLRKEFERGELFSNYVSVDGIGYEVITTIKDLAFNSDNRSLFRKVVTELTERELVIEHLLKALEKMKGTKTHEVIEQLYDLGMLKPIQEG